MVLNLVRPIVPENEIRKTPGEKYGYMWPPFRILATAMI
jgi:hypothetical protein